MFAAADSVASHLQDTFQAGAGLCDTEVARLVIERWPDAVRGLIDLGVRFDRGQEGGDFDLGRECGHTHRRVLHAADLTGHEIERVLVERC